MVNLKRIACLFFDIAKLYVQQMLGIKNDHPKTSTTKTVMPTPDCSESEFETDDTLSSDDDSDTDDEGRLQRRYSSKSKAGTATCSYSS